MKSFTPPRNALNGGSDDDGDHPNQPIDLNKSVFPEPRSIAARARLRRLQFRSKNRLAHEVESKLHMSDPDDDEDEDEEEDESENSVTKKMKLEDGSSAYHGAAPTSPPPSPPPYPPPSPPPPPPSPPSPPPPPPSSPPPSPPPPPAADSS